MACVCVCTCARATMEETILIAPLKTLVNVDTIGFVELLKSAIHSLSSIIGKK